MEVVGSLFLIPHQTAWLQLKKSFLSCLNIRNFLNWMNKNNLQHLILTCTVNESYVPKVMSGWGCMYINTWDALHYKEMGGSLLVTPVHSALVCFSFLDIENGGWGILGGRLLQTLPGISWLRVVKISNKVEQLSLVIGEHQRETETLLEIL